ncbi:MAG: hypothetical protein NTW75_13035 [Planctomycetales bacterium]|jgi:hypothetical protein|nr:hypothetical protein [Planctomycetales bacterium]
MSDDWDDDGYIDCPFCGKTMLEDAEYCPSCDRWLTSEGLPKQDPPLWIIIGIVLCLGITLTWILSP